MRAETWRVALVAQVADENPLARMAALQGAELALVPTAWLGPAEEWEHALRARALDNTIFVAGADLLAESIDCRGLSMIVGPRGELLARATPGEETVIAADLDPEVMTAQRTRVNLLKDRRPDRYGALARKRGDR